MQCRKCKVEIPRDSLFCLYCGVKQALPAREQKPKTRENGTGSVYRLPNGKWRLAITLGYTEDKKRVYKTKSGFKTKKEALEYLPTLVGESDKPKDIYVWQLFSEWKRSVENAISKSTMDGYVNCYEKYCGSIKGKKLLEIKTADLQDCVDSCAQSPRMKQLVKVTLSTLFKYAEQNDYVKENYAKFVKVPKQIKPDKDAFSEKEIDQIWEAYRRGNHFMRYALIMIYSGLRPAELRQLTPERIDVKKKTLTAGVKTESGIDRKIPICDKIIPLLPEARFDFTRHQFYSDYKDAFQKTEIRYLPPHCCRHTTATALVLAGVDPKIIQEILGHSSFTVTADNYVHIPMSNKIEAVNKI